MFATSELRTSSRPVPLQARGLVQIIPDVDLPGFTMSFARDEEIFGEGEPAEFVYKVVTGVVRTSRVLDDGRRQISSFYFPGDVFGLEFGNEHVSTAEAVGQCDVMLVRRVALKRMTEKDSSAACEFWALTSQELMRAQSHLLLLGRKTAAERVATFLLDMADRESTPHDVKIPMSRADIADYLGLTIETVSRTLTQLERTGAIELSSSRQIVLRNLDALEHLEA